MAKTTDERSGSRKSLAFALAEDRSGGAASPSPARGTTSRPLRLRDGTPARESDSKLRRRQARRPDDVGDASDGADEIRSDVADLAVCEDAWEAEIVAGAKERLAAFRCRG
jgi:hypothetical protein